MNFPKVVVLWRGDRRSPQTPTHYGERLAPVLDALRDADLAPTPVVHFDARPDETRAHLAGAAAVLVWVNPIADGEDRTIVNALLCEAAQDSALVSAHPDVIAKMGVKSVLYATRELGWGSNTEIYGSLADFEARFPAKVTAKARVLKPDRGNDGRNVLKIARAGKAFSVQHAFDDSTEQLDLPGLSARLAPAFDAGGVIDQQWHPASGMVRCYMCGGGVVGFGEQDLRHPGDGAFAMNSAKAMHGADHAARADLRAAMESEWAPGLLRLLDMNADDLPVLWDADFLLTSGGYRLCEINVSCVSPFPPAAPQAIAAAVRARLAGRRGDGALD